MKHITKLFTRLATIAALGLLTAATAWGATNTVTLTQTSLGLTGSYTTSTEKTIDGITYVYTDLMKSTDNIQAKASSGLIYNKTAYSGDITSVAITHYGTARATTILGSSDGTEWTQVATGSGSITGDFSGKGYKYFKITRGNNAAYWTKIEITYSTSSTPTCATPTFSPEAGAVLSGTTVAISAATEGATVYYTMGANPEDPTTNSSVYSEPIAITAATTIKAIAVKEGYDNSTVASATYTIITPKANIAALTAETTDGSYYVTLNNAVVTFASGNYAYIQDNSGAVAMYKSGGLGLTAGDVLNGTASVTYQLRNANPQITDISGVTSTSGTAPNPTEVAAEDWSYTFNNVLSQYFKITGATLTLTSNKYYITLGDDSVQLYKVGTAPSGLDLTKTYTVTGFPTLYNATKELQMFVDPEVEISAEPTILVSPTSLTGFTYEEGSGPSTAKTISVSGANLTANIVLSLSGSAFEMSLSENSNYSNSLTLTQESGAVAATTVFVRLKAGQTKDNYSGTITLTSTGAENCTVSLSGNVTEYVSPYAALPFEFDGGKNAIATTAGISQSGLGSDYDSSPKLKFDGTGDYVVLQFNERPAKLTFDIKGNGFSGGTFTVQTSTDGSTYTDLKTYTELGATQSESFDNLGENVRYIKWVYSSKSNGNVALGNIALTKYTTDPVITVADAPTNTSADGGEGSLAITYEFLEIETADDFGVQFYDADGNELSSSDEPDWIVVEVEAAQTSGYVVSYVVDANEGDARAAYFKVFAEGDEDFVYSNLVIVNQDAYVAPPIPSGWVKTTLADLTSNDVFVIVSIDDEGNYYAMSNDNGTSAPSAVQLEGSFPGNVKWNIGGNADEGYVFYPNGSTETWLYCTNTNNGVKVGTNTSNTFALDETGYLKHLSTSRFVGVYFESGVAKDWRCYTNTTGNIAGQTFAFYKKAVPADTPATYTLTATFGDGCYWATFFNADAQYVLSEGAQAFTMDENKNLYRVGPDGTVIPENTAVVIISDTETITLTQNNKASASVHDTNILQGSNAPVAKTGTQYVLGKVGNKIGFYQFNGTNIPANKAYYVNE